MGRGLLGGAEGKSGSRCDEVNRISEGDGDAESGRKYGFLWLKN